jgi:hypothetical protein
MNTKNKQKISEKEETPTILVPKNELPQMIKQLKGQKVNILPVNEMDGVIEPQDRATIQYLSNVKHPETGQIAQPFNIADKKYQMVRGITPQKNIVMGVYCFDDMDDNGNNMIYHVDEFESKVAKPMLEMEKLTTENEDKSSQSESLNLGEYKHFIVNEKSGKFKKFKTIPELAATTMLEGEKYMGLYEFKKFFEYRVFGVPKKKSMPKVENQQHVVESKVVKTIKKKDIK